MNDSLRHALDYARRGCRVYPVWGMQARKCLCGGRGGCRPGEHPWGLMVPNGGPQATAGADTIRKWFPAPAVNVGIRVDGFCVLDAEKAGMPLLAEWGPMPTTPTAESGGGGRHYYFNYQQTIGRMKPLEKVRFVAGAELPTGGGVIAPPSNHKDGGRYRWTVGPETPRADMLTWLETHIANHLSADTSLPADEPLNPMKGAASPGETFADVGQLEPGRRSDALNRVIGAMLGRGLSREQILEQGRPWARKQEPPGSESDLEGKVKFARKHEADGDPMADSGPVEADCRTTPTYPDSQFADSPPPLAAPPPP